MSAGWRCGLGIGVTLCLAGCMVPVGEVGSPQVVAGRDYQAVSECLFRQGEAEGRVMELAVYQCARKAELRDGGERMEVWAGEGGAVVHGSLVGLMRIDQSLQRCGGMPSR